MYNASFIFSTSLYTIRMTVNKGFKLNAVFRTSMRFIVSALVIWIARWPLTGRRVSFGGREFKRWSSNLFKYSSFNSFKILSYHLKKRKPFFDACNEIAFSKKNLHKDLRFRTSGY